MPDYAESNYNSLWRNDTSGEIPVQCGIFINSSWSGRHKRPSCKKRSQIHQPESDFQLRLLCYQISSYWTTESSADRSWRNQCFWRSSERNRTVFFSPKSLSPKNRHKLPAEFHKFQQNQRNSPDIWRACFKNWNCRIWRKKRRNAKAFQNNRAICKHIYSHRDG